MRVYLLTPVIAGLLLSGCAEINSIYRARPIKPDSLAHVVTVDAKQRHLLLNPEVTAPVAGDGGVRWRMCAEAAPDVFSAYATSASAKGGVKDRDVSAELGISSAETAATIERTQTINMLRESMYRTCERYLSGAIGRTTFITQAARDQRSMIAFLAIEQLTRTARPPSTIISGPATNASIRDGEAAAKLVDEFRKEAVASAAALARTRADLDAGAAKNDCKANEKAVVKDDASDADKAKAQDEFAECMRLKTLEATQAAADKLAQERLDQALKLAAETVTSINAATRAVPVKDGAGGGGVDPQTAAVLSDAVIKIAGGASIDESLMFCIAYLSEPKIATEVEAAIASVAKAQVNPAPAKDATGMRTVPLSTVEMCNEVIHQRAMLDNDRLLVSASDVISHNQTSATDELARFLAPGAADGTARVAAVRDALKSLGFASNPAAVVRLTTGVDEARLAAVLRSLKVRYPDAFK